MGLFDSLKGALEGEALPALLNTVLAQTQYHDLNGLVAALQKGGLGPQVQSWLGNGQNMPITAGVITRGISTNPLTIPRPANS